MEVLNWGTFHKQVWGLDLGGNNALLTGDIGSGKSTLVDAITALLVPRANFNKAAGAATGERSLETYFFGRYKSERGEPGLSSKPVSLRGPDSYSVLLCRFFNEALAQHVTLAQVFWAKAPQGPPARLFVIAGPAALHQRALRRFRRRHQHAAQAPARHGRRWNCSRPSRPTARRTGIASASRTNRRWICSTRPSR